MNKLSFDLSVYFICDPSLCGGRDFVEVALAAVRGGATMVQLRDKSDDVLVHAKRLKAAGLSVPLLINDHVEIARDVGADGVHIGQGDMDAAAARALLGVEAIIGLTAFTEDHMAAVDPMIVDYVGTGPFFETLTDKGKPVLGAARFAEIAALAPVPVVGIGGIAAENYRQVLEAGADGVAMMRAVSMAEDVAGAVRGFRVWPC